MGSALMLNLDGISSFVFGLRAIMIVYLRDVVYA